MRQTIGAAIIYVVAALFFGDPVPQYNSQVRMFFDSIQEQETGSMQNPHVRTSKITPEGSSAFGLYQVTKGLVDGALKIGGFGFTKKERSAMIHLSGEQAKGLEIGGRDRELFEGVKSKAYLDMYDYGGPYDMTAEQRELVTSATKKILYKTLENSGWDPLEAAKRWHGGSRHGDEPQHVEYGTEVMENFIERMSTQKPGSSVDKVPERSYRRTLR